MQTTNWIVFILGAGASAPSKLPVMAGFMNRARRLAQTTSDQAAKDAYDTMFEFWKRCRDSSWAFRRHWDNIEELYTQADLLRLAGLNAFSSKASPERLESPYDMEDVCTRIAWCIWDVYRQFIGCRPWHQIANRVLDANMRLGIITTNYDLIVEASISQVDSKFCYHYPGFPLAKAKIALPQTQKIDRRSWESVWQDDKPSEIVPVAKLHGSVNWFENSNGEWAFWPDFADIVPNDERSGLRLSRTEMCQSLNKPHGASEWKPAIIPPMIGKMSHSPVIQENWHAAIQMLSRARQIWLIGYSFPQTDAFMLLTCTEFMYQAL